MSISLKLIPIPNEIKLKMSIQFNILLLFYLNRLCSNLYSLLMRLNGIPRGDIGRIIRKTVDELSFKRRIKGILMASLKTFDNIERSNSHLE